MFDENDYGLIPLESKIKIESKTRDLLDVSIIIPCKNEANNLKSTLNSIIKSESNLSYEVIVVDDGSTDQSTEFLKQDLSRYTYKDVILLKTKGIGCARAKNFGAKFAKGKYLLFCDAHVEVPKHWIDDLVDTLKNYNAHLVTSCIEDISNSFIQRYGGTWNGKLQYMWIENKPKGIIETPFAVGGNMGITKEVFKKLNGFDNLFQIYGAEDQELSIKAWLYGYRIVVNPNVKMKHLFRDIHPYKVTESNTLFNTLCLAYYHFSKNRIIKTIDTIKHNYYFPNAIADMKKNMDLILNQREKYFNERIYDDDYFFKKFGIPF